MFENTLYPEVREALAALQLHGHRMRIVTAKPQPYAMRILQHFRIEGFFEAVHGPSLQDRTHNKAKLVEDALRATGSRHQTVMVGDRAEDILAARVNGIAAIAATWGYGSATELAEVNPDGVAENMGHVIHIVERWARAGSGPQYKEPVSEVLDRIDNG
jgi:phosphoglycolate phosphatase